MRRCSAGWAARSQRSYDDRDISHHSRDGPWFPAGDEHDSAKLVEVRGVMAAAAVLTLYFRGSLQVRGSPVAVRRGPSAPVGPPHNVAGASHRRNTPFAGPTSGDK